MRRLPIYFLLDCSESMVGRKIEDMENAFQSIVKSLRADPYALETAYISVIAFAGVAQTIAPLVETYSFYPPKLPLGSGTNLGDAITVLMHEIDTNVKKTTTDTKGDWKPIIYLFTDGKPTDNPDYAIQKWREKYSSKATMVAVGLGRETDFSYLKSLTEHCFLYEESSPDDFKKFIDWVTDSILTQTKSVAENKDITVLEFDPSVLEKVSTAQQVIDESCVTIVGRCSKKKNPYLMKYDREIKEIRGREFSFDLAGYALTGCYPINEDYFVWSGESKQELKINTSLLVGAPGCPYCGNASAFAMCSCGGVLCVNGPGGVNCPWCDNEIFFDMGSSEDEGFDVGRGRG